jgi:hypothetical protein
MQPNLHKEQILNLKLNHPKHYCVMLRRKFPEIWQKIENYHEENFRGVSFPSPQRIFNWVYQISEVPKCPVKNTPLKFREDKFEYRQFSGRGIYTEKFTKERMKNRTRFPDIQQRLNGMHENQFVYEERYPEIALKQVNDLLSSTKNIGGVCVAIKNKKNAKLYFFIKKMYPDIKNFVECLYCFVHQINEPPLCPLSKKLLPFINFKQGYKKTHSEAANILKKQTKEKRKFEAVLLSKEETIIQTQALIKELQDNNLSLNNLKQSAYKRNPNLILSIEEYTKEYKTLSKKWSERVYLLIHGLPEREKIRFYSFDEGYYDTFIDPKSSKGERELADWIETLNLGKVLRNERILNRQEIDILLPELKIGIEYHGEFYHHYDYKGSSYHKQKADLSIAEEINLIQIFETEWYNKKEIVKSILKTKLGIIDKKIFARQCEIKVLDKKIKNVFLNQNHIQGCDRSQIALGLFYKDSLVSCMTFGRGYNQKKNEIELVRFCTEINTIVVGGASKLLKFFINQYFPKKITTYADRRFANNSNFYETLGFIKTGQTVPNYFYFKPTTPEYMKLQHRYNFAKHLLVRKLTIFDPSKTEYENMKANGYLKIYDAGSYKYELILD